MQKSNLLALIRNIRIKCTFDKSDVLDAKAIDVAKKQIKKAGLVSDVDINKCFIYKKSIGIKKFLHNF